jgi:hypothetical protein
MLENIFIGKIKKAFLKNIDRIAKKEGEESIQIRLKFGERPEEPIYYAICSRFQLLEKSTYKEIMNMKIDILGEEAMVTPVLYEAMKNQCIKYEVNIPDFSAFLFKHNDSVGVAIYNIAERKLLCRIEDLFGA